MFNNILPNNLDYEFFNKQNHVDTEKTAIYGISSALNTDEYIKNVFDNIKTNQSVSFIDIIVSDDDACINSAFFQIDKNHKRFYTKGEIIALIEKYADLIEFKAGKINIEFKNINFENNKDSVVKEFKLMPEHIKKYINLKELDNEIISFSLTAGLFTAVKK